MVYCTDMVLFVTFLGITIEHEINRQRIERVVVCLVGMKTMRIKRETAIDERPVLSNLAAILANERWYLEPLYKVE